MGSDDWRNGIPLCSTHHHAFDADLFGIVPETMAIVIQPGLRGGSLGIAVDRLLLLRNRPHDEALGWRFEATASAWKESETQP